MYVSLSYSFMSNKRAYLFIKNVFMYPGPSTPGP